MASETRVIDEIQGECMELEQELEDLIDSFADAIREEGKAIVLGTLRPDAKPLAISMQLVKEALEDYSTWVFLLEVELYDITCDLIKYCRVRARKLLIMSRYTHNETKWRRLEEEREELIHLAAELRILQARLKLWLMYREIV